MFDAAKFGMKTPTKILLAITAAAALSFAHPASANLITNPGFETGDLTGWTISPGGPFVTGTFNGIAPHSGNFQLVADAGGTLSQSVATTTGATYVIDFFVALNNPGILSTLSVQFGGTVFSHLFSGTNGYTEFTFNATALGPSSVLTFSFSTGPLLWFLDDVSVTPTGVGVPDAGSTLPLLGFASLGLVALRRKLSY